MPSQSMKISLIINLEFIITSLVVSREGMPSKLLDGASKTVWTIGFALILGVMDGVNKVSLRSNRVTAASILKCSGAPLTSIEHRN